MSWGIVKDILRCARWRHREEKARKSDVAKAGARDLSSAAMRDACDQSCESANVAELAVGIRTSVSGKGTAVELFALDLRSPFTSSIFPVWVPSARMAGIFRRRAEKHTGGHVDSPKDALPIREHRRNRYTSTSVFLLAKIRINLTFCAI